MKLGTCYCTGVAEADKRTEGGHRLVDREEKNRQVEDGTQAWHVMTVEGVYQTPGKERELTN